jgi:hypothetical protein
MAGTSTRRFTSDTSPNSNQRIELTRGTGDRSYPVVPPSFLDAIVETLFRRIGACSMMTVECSGDIYWTHIRESFEPQLGGVFISASVSGFHRPRLSIN